MQHHPFDAKPWWQHPYLWLVIAGPALVVLASAVTLLMALNVPDPAVAKDYYRVGSAPQPTTGQADLQLAPAMQARNHVVTPVQAPAKPSTHAP